MKLCSIASSSSGNCIYVGSEGTHLLIDVGISGKKVKQGLETIGLDPNELHGILITHEHSDHIKGLGVISRKYKVPIYATGKTINRLLKNKQLGYIEEHLFNPIASNDAFSINDLSVKAVKTSHDAIDSVCYTFKNNNKKVSVATDLGCYNDYIIENLSESNILFLEANHDLDMLKNGSYPYPLKQRIKSDLGHLSNIASGQLLNEIYHDELRYIILGHLSNENNKDEVAYKSVIQNINDHEINQSVTEVFVASKYEASKLVEV